MEHSSHLLQWKIHFTNNLSKGGAYKWKRLSEEYVPMLVKLDILIKKCLWSINSLLGVYPIVLLYTYNK